MRLVLAVILLSFFGIEAQARGPAVEEVFSISIDDAPVVQPDQNNGYPFKQTTRSYLQNNPQLAGRGDAQGSLFSGTMTFLSLVALLLLPLLIRFVIMNLYRESQKEPETTLERRDPQNQDKVVPLKERRVQGQSSKSTAEDQAQEKKRAS